MGMFDTFLPSTDTDVDDGIQIKAFACVMDVYAPGDTVAGSAVPVPVSVSNPCDSRWVNVDPDGVFVSVTDTPLYDHQVSKWGGPAGQENPVVAAIRQLIAAGRTDDTDDTDDLDDPDDTVWPGFEVREVEPHVVLDTLNRIPEFTTAPSRDELDARLEGRDVLALAVFATPGGEIAGVKLGYSVDDRTFYSWLGGVLPAHRRRYVAQRLLEAQHDWCRAHGYRTVTVKSMNRYRPMMAMLLDSGYTIVGIEGSDPATFKVRFAFDL